MTQFINADNIATARKERKETVFNHVLTGNGWKETDATVKEYKKIIYLGRCKNDGDMFACYYHLGTIVIFRGTKGDEFND